MTKKYQYVFIVSLVLLLVSACGGGSGGNGGSSENQNGEPLTIEERLTAELNTANSNTDFTFLVQANNGAEFEYKRGSSSALTSYRSASSSKLVTAAVILLLVDQGMLALDDHPQAYLSFWPQTGELAAIELRHLLSFTSGLIQEPLCLNIAVSNFESCVENILDANATIATPGEEFYYASTHLQVAGLMAIRASGLNNWQEVFDYFKSQTQLFSNAVYDLPSVGNPRLAGGMHWQANEYLAFLSALYQQELFSPLLHETMISDQVEGLIISNSPVNAEPLALDWHYGFGLWIECPSVPFDCIGSQRISSPGAYGAYPFIDFENKYVGIVAREGELGTWSEGYETWAAVEAELQIWAADNL